MDQGDELAVGEGICLRGRPGRDDLLAPLTTTVNTMGGTWFRSGEDYLSVCHTSLVAISDSWALVNGGAESTGALFGYSAL